jgi:transcriptional regulator with XRE-family HTH domain
LNTLNERLRNARQRAGFDTATRAIDLFGWKNSTYRAHENGQNNYGVEEAKAYAMAYGVTPSWLLIGDTKETSPSSTVQKTAQPHKHNCVNVISATALLLKDDRDNIELITKLDECVQSLKKKSGLI